MYTSKYPIKHWISVEEVFEPIIIFIGIGYFVEMNDDVTLAHNKLYEEPIKYWRGRRDHSEETFLNITSGDWQMKRAAAALLQIPKLCIRKLELNSGSRQHGHKRCHIHLEFSQHADDGNDINGTVIVTARRWIWRKAFIFHTRSISLYPTCHSPNQFFPRNNFH